LGKAINFRTRVDGDWQICCALHVMEI